MTKSEETAREKTPEEISLDYFGQYHLGLMSFQTCVRNIVEDERKRRDTALRERDEKVEKLEEQRIMELAAISTATFQNTELTVKDRIDRINPYYTVAYGDVCRAIDREMNLRAKLAEAEKWIRHLPSCRVVMLTYQRPCTCGLDNFRKLKGE